MSTHHTSTDLLVLQSIQSKGQGAADQANINHGYWPVQGRNKAQIRTAVDRLVERGLLTEQGIHWAITAEGAAVLDQADALLDTIDEWTDQDDDEATIQRRLAGQVMGS